MKEFKIELSNVVKSFVIKDVDKNIEKSNNKFEMTYTYMGDKFRPIGGVACTGYDVVRLIGLYKKSMRQILLEAEIMILKKIYPDELIILHIKTTEQVNNEEVVTLNEINF